MVRDGDPAAQVGGNGDGEPAAAAGDEAVGPPLRLGAAHEVAPIRLERSQEVVPLRLERVVEPPIPLVEVAAIPLRPEPAPRRPAAGREVARAPAAAVAIAAIRLRRN
jgi:hypothetical protein